MSLDVLTALAFVAGVGGLTASIIGVITCARRNPPQPPDDTPGAEPPPRTLAFGWEVCWPLRIWFGLLVLSVVLLILAVAGLLSIIGENETNVFIEDPDDGAIVEQITLVRGTGAHLPDTSQIWVIVMPRGSATYYPQAEVVRIDHAGEDDDWSTRAVIGAPEDTEGAFDILAVLANENASAILREHMSDPDSGTFGPPMDTLPDDVTIYEQIAVVRR